MMLVNHALPPTLNCDVVAFTNCDVDEAKSPVWNHDGVVVAFVVVA